MNSTRLFKKTVIAATIALASQQAVAAGFQLNAQSATGLGRAFAGDAVIADNASVMSRNPAAMALFDETSMSLGFTSITSQIEVKDAKYYQNAIGVPYNDSSNYADAGDTSVAPNLYLIVPVNDKFAWGVSAYSNFGTKTEFDDSFVGSEYGGLTDVKSANIGVSGSYRINEQFSVGAGLDIIYGQGKMVRSLKVYNPSNGSVISSKNMLDAEGSGWALGFNLGTVYEMDENNRFGLSYRYSPTIDAKGDVKTPLGTADTLVMPLPDMAEFSGFHKITDTKFAVHYSVQWIGWSSFDKLGIEKDGSEVANKKYEWQNGMHYSIGGTYYLNESWTLRTGYMHDTSAQDQLTSVSVPDSNRNWFSAGFTYHLDTKSNIDFGFTYLLGQDVNVEEKTYLDPTDLTKYTSIEATTRANAILVGLQYSRSF